MLRLHDKIAIQCADRRYTYDDLSRYAQCYADAYGSIGKESKVAIFAPNSPEWIFAFYGIIHAKAIAVPIDELATPDELAYVLKDALPDVLVTTSERCASVQKVLHESGVPTRVVVMEEVPVANVNERVPMDIPAGEPDDVVLIIYTSGTAGTPKGVMLTYRNILYNVDAVSKSVHIFDPERNVMILLPLHHAFPLMGSMVAPLRVGATVVIASKLNAESVLQTLNDGKISIIIGVPRLYDLLAKGVMSKINERRITRWLYKMVNAIGWQWLSKTVFAAVHKKFGGHIKFLVSGGAALSIETARIYKALGFYVLEGYGMTETAPMISFTRPGGRKIGYAGHPLPGIEVRIDDNGEVCVRGDNVMAGYYHREEETEAVIRDGWLHTGDTGILDKYGLKLTGRIKDIIVTSNGKNINPEEIENALSKHYACIKEVGVCAPDGILTAIVVPEMSAVRDDTGRSLDDTVRDAILDYNKNAVTYKRLRNFHVISTELPKTKLGKLQRFLLEPLLEKNQEEKPAESEMESLGETYDLLKHFVDAETGTSAAPDSHFEIDLAMDSLTRVALLAYVESTFDVKITPNQLEECSTLRTLTELIETQTHATHSNQKSWREILLDKISQVRLNKPGITHWCVDAFIRCAMPVVYKIKGQGMENIPQDPCLMIANHRSYMDAPSIISQLTVAQSRRTYFFAKAKHWRSKFMAFMAKKNNLILMDINQNVTAALQQVAAALMRGKNVIIFPEGTRSKDGKLGKFKETFAIISQALNVPIVPVVIEGTERALGRWGKLPYFRFRFPISVRFLKPVYPLPGDEPKSTRDYVFSIFQDALKEKKE